MCDLHVPAVTAADLRNPFRWLVVVPASPEASRRIERQMEQAREAGYARLLGAILGDGA